MSSTPPPSDDEIVGGLLQQGLDVAYQPIVELASGDLVGWEALLRGQLPEHGALSPLHVVGSATRIGALDTVMRQVAEQALATASVASLRLGRSLTVTVNLEPAQIWPGSPFLQWLIDRSRSCPAQLLLEVTERGEETAWGEDQELALDQLQEAGLGIAIDDLGTGVSRLRLLARREWTWVKLDRGFLLLGDRGLVLLRHTVAMLHELGTVVLLEGIETEEQLQIARTAGVDLVQGNLLACPMSSDMLLGHLADTPSPRATE